MPQMCPRTCGRLATAAVLISVGVVQLVAGLILARSKYVYLLSAPNFWTAAANFAVGGLLGISASVWKETQKVSPKHSTRRNLLASLVMSSLLMNGTTAAILVLGEGNTLLSIKLERNGATLASELLAYAFATSVCSPIVCIVVACIFLSGLCFRRLEKNADTTKTKNVLNEDDAYAYSWVFKPRLGRIPNPDPTIVRKALSTRYLSSSTEDDDSFDSPDTILHRSNSLPSVDGSLLDVTRRVRTRSDSNVFQQPSHDSRTTMAEHIRDRNKVSFVNESLKGRMSLPRHFKAGERSNLEVFKARKNDAHLEFSSRRPMSVRKEQPKLLTKGSGGFISYKELAKMQYRTDLLLNPEKSSVVADVHMDLGNFENDKAFVDYNNSAEESTLVYEADSSSSDVFVRFEDGDRHWEKPKIRRTSTARSLKSLEAINQAKDCHKTVRRTSTAISSKSPDEFRVMEESRYDASNFGQNGSNSTLKNSRFENVLCSSKRFSEEPGIVDDYFDTPTATNLVGEVVPIQVSTLPKKLSSKLIPVSIPEVSGVRKYSLKAAKSYDNRYRKNKNENRRRASSVVRTSKFHSDGEPKLVSFRGGTKTNVKENRSKSGTLPRKQATTRRDPVVTPEPTPPQPAEYEPRENRCPSPAHTSGYMSALEDTLNSSNKSRSAETTMVSPSTSGPGSSIGQTHRRTVPDDWNSKYIRSSKGCDAVKEVLNRIDNESSAFHSKERLIDQLLNDPSFQKIMMQTLKETEI